MAAVTLFNPSSSPLQVMVNNGSQLVVPAAIASNGFAPGELADVLKFEDGNPVPGVFGWGTNVIEVNTDGSPRPDVCLVRIPAGTAIPSLQVYLFFQPGATFLWGSFAAGQLLGWHTAAAA